MSDLMGQAIEILQKGQAAPAAKTDPTTQDPASQVIVAAPEAPSALPVADAQPAVAPTLPETAKPKAAPEAADEASFASKFAALARRERELQKREAAIKAAKTEDVKQASKAENPLEALKQAGWTYEEVTQFILNDGKLTPEKQIASVHDEVKALKEKLEASERMAKEAEQKKVVNDFKSEIVAQVAAGGEKYELIAGNKAHNLVYETIEAFYQRTAEEEGEGRVLSIEEACDMVERHLEEESEKWLAFKKIQGKFAAKMPKPASAPVESAMKKETTVTLTNQEATAPKAVRTQTSNPDELIEEAKKLLRFK